MPYVLCDVVREKQGPLEKSVAVRSAQGHREFLEVPAAFLHREGGKSYLAVGLVSRDLRQDLALVELPFEADSGANHVWVATSSVLDPAPAPDEGLISSTSLDLTLAASLEHWVFPGNPGDLGLRFRPAHPDWSFDEVKARYLQPVPLNADNAYDLKPNVFVLGWTVQRVYLPHSSRLYARVEGKSSLARLGLGVHVTAPTVAKSGLFPCKLNSSTSLLEETHQDDVGAAACSGNSEVGGSALFPRAASRARVWACTISAGESGSRTRW